MDIHKSLYRIEDVPQEMVERRAEVVGRLKALEEGAYKTKCHVERLQNHTSP
jgi:translation initiation factor 3 subunit E